MTNELIFATLCLVMVPQWHTRSPPSAGFRRLWAVMMLTYGDVVIDIDLGIGRQYGYRHPARADITEDNATVTRNAAACHPDRPAVAHGLCGMCYMRGRKHKRGAS